MIFAWTVFRSGDDSFQDTDCNWRGPARGQLHAIHQAVRPVTTAPPSREDSGNLDRRGRPRSSVSSVLYFCMWYSIAINRVFVNVIGRVLIALWWRSRCGKPVQGLCDNVHAPMSIRCIRCSMLASQNMFGCVFIFIPIFNGRRLYEV